MKPLGTITGYLPFLDSDTSRIMLEVMDAAEDYADFVERLCDRVCSEETTELAVFMAARHALNIDAVNCLAKISERYGNFPLVRPILFLEAAQLGDENGCVKSREAADAVIAANPPDWLIIEMHMLKFWTAVFDYPAGAYTADAVEYLERLISGCQNPMFYRAQLLVSLAGLAFFQGDIEGGTEKITRANSLAAELDNQFLLASGLQICSGWIEPGNNKKRRELLRAAGDIWGNLGATVALADVICDLASLDTTEGAYSAAIERYTESLRILETLGAPTLLLIPKLASAYAAIGDGEAALAWAQMAETKGDASYFSVAKCRLDQARALILMEELQQARDVIELARESVFRSGRESNLMWLHFVEGLLEIAEGDYSCGAMSLEKALEISERCAPHNVNDCMLQLARAEVLAAVQSYRIHSDQGEGYWLARLEDSARSEDKRGLLGKALLLKAELYLARHKHREASTVLEEVGVLACEPGLEFLHKDLDPLLKRFDDLTQQKLQR